MKKVVVIFVVITMLCMSVVGVNGSQNTSKNITKFLQNSVDITVDENLYEKFSQYIPNSENKEIKKVVLPWSNSMSDLLEWNIRIVYNGQIFEKNVPVSVNDFTEKFLKHPEYGELLYFDVDNDGANEIEVIVGFYWSIIKDADGKEVKSLEKRFRVRLLEGGGYLNDPDGEFEVWSEIHINYGLFKGNSAKSKEVNSPFYSIKSRLQVLINKIYDKFNNLKILSNIIDKLFVNPSENKNIVTLEYDNDYISLGAGYRSPQNENIPRYVEKRFAFAREKIFSPTIFQHQIDPGSSAGQGPFELLYGFRSFKADNAEPAYDIAFSVEFDPAVVLKTKFIPLGGYVYYYFEDESQRYSETAITFTSNILKGDGEDIELSLVFDKIDSTLGRTGQWMSFDIDMLGDHEPLGGSFHYKASDEFTVGVVVNSPVFEEKVEILNMPKRIDCSWDLDFVLAPGSLLYAHVDGFIDLDMSSDLGGVNVYYPKTDPSAEDQIFIDVPGGIPSSAKFEAAATLNVDLKNLKNPANYVYGKIKHTCSSNLDSIRAFLPDLEVPIVKVTDIPAYSEVKGQLIWNTLQGYAYCWRGASGPPDPVEINLEYQGFKIHNILTIRDGHIDTRFKVAESGYFFFDTTEGMFGNDLEVSNTLTGDTISLFVDEVSADGLNADWDIDTSGEKLKINGLNFGGMVDTLKGLELDLNYKGKKAAMNLDWVIGQTGYFEIQVDQEDDLTIDFGDFAQNSTTFDIAGGITISDVILFDMSWGLKQGEKDGGNVDPGFFSINENNDQSIIKHFDFCITYQDKYGISIDFDNLRFYLDLEWWKGDRILPYVWLDYDVSADKFDVDLLWTNRDGQTQWYYNIEDW